MRVPGLAWVASLLAIAAGLGSGATSARADGATYQAHHRPAQELAALVGFSLRAEAPAMTADEKTNQVLITGPTATVTLARARLAELDRAPVALSLELFVHVDGQVVWQARVAALSGVTARVELAGARSLPLPAGGTLVGLKGSFTATRVESASDLRATLEAALDGASGPRTVRLKGSARLAGDPVQEVAHVQLSTGRALQLKARVTNAR